MCSYLCIANLSANDNLQFISKCAIIDTKRTLGIVTFHLYITEWLVPLEQPRPALKIERNPLEPEDALNQSNSHKWGTDVTVSVVGDEEHTETCAP